MNPFMKHFHYAPTSWAANIAAYGEDSSRSALTFIPPVTREMVSRPDRSVMWTKVSLKEAKMRATPKTSSPYMKLIRNHSSFMWASTCLADLGSKLRNC